MSSLLANFEYDVYVSYRHRDNKYDGWVTEFVSRLNAILPSLIREKVSIYFDQNTRDGLQDGHLVDKSLTKKLNSFIFLPIVSLTYCDPICYAWKNEFLSFKQMALHSSFGLDVTLLNDNVASRILPIRVNELDDEDVETLEDHLNGHFRCIDFIYTQKGVNRPLTPRDDDAIYISGQLLYRNQINSVATAIRDLIKGAQKTLNTWTLKTVEIGNSDTNNDGKVASINPKPASISDEFQRSGSTAIKVAEAPPEIIQPHTTLVTNLSLSVIEEVNQSRNTKNTSIDTTTFVKTAISVKADAPMVYLAWVSSDLKSLREEMIVSLNKAGFRVCPTIDCPADDSTFVELSKEYLLSSDCSVQLLSNEFGRRFEYDECVSYPMYQYQLAKENVQSLPPNFQQFIVYCQDHNRGVKPDQQKFVDSIIGNLNSKIHFTSSNKPLGVINELKYTYLFGKPTTQKDTDLFFLFHSEDEGGANDILDILSDEISIDQLNVFSDAEAEYKEIALSHATQSLLSVVYFQHRADWAISFTKSVWRDLGGANAVSPIFLVGDSFPESNKKLVFPRGPFLCSTLATGNKIPEIIRTQFHKCKSLYIDSSGKKSNNDKFVCDFCETNNTKC